jgi:uncharacterized protein YraI
MRSRVLVALASLLPLLAASQSMAQVAAAPDQGEASESLFVVEGVAHNDLLNVRATASPSGKVVGRVPNGVVLRNQGCGDFNGARWCKVESVEDASLSGWVAGRYLSEAFEEAAAMPPIEGGEESSDNAGLAANFDSTGEIPCARYYGQPMTRCSAVSTRGSEGEATITVSWPDGGTRVIFFRDGRADESDSSDPLTYTREADLNMIRIGKSERFEIPDTLPFGG